MKQKFDLSVWLEDKSRKVVTKTGEEVKIIDTNAPDENNPIIGYIYHKQKWNGPWSWHIDGVYKVGGDDMDLFFADEEEELTEFEKLLQFLLEHYSGHKFATKTEIDVLKTNAKALLNLARKEILKDLPKWKRDCFHNINSVVDGRLYYNGYYVDINELKLPKEE